MTASPGLKLFAGQSNALSWTQNGLSCTGGFVSAGNLTAHNQTPKAVRCSGIIGIVDAGTATIVWTSPANMGKTTMKLNMKITSTSKPSATRDLADLVKAGLLWTTGQGKATRYYINVPGWNHGVVDTADTAAAAVDAPASLHPRPKG